MPSLRPVRARLLDMFPNTGHYEVLALLERAVSARERLEEERRRTTQRLAELRGDYRGFVEASQDTNADDEHDPEGATIAFERSQVGALVRQAEEHLAAGRRGAGPGRGRDVRRVRGLRATDPRRAGSRCGRRR